VRGQTARQVPGSSAWAMGASRRLVLVVRALELRVPVPPVRVLLAPARVLGLVSWARPRVPDQVLREEGLNWVSQEGLEATAGPSAVLGPEAPQAAAGLGERAGLAAGPAAGRARVRVDANPDLVCGFPCDWAGLPLPVWLRERHRDCPPWVSMVSSRGPSDPGLPGSGPTGRQAAVVPVAGGDPAQ
jgi:hypothetical protein